MPGDHHDREHEAVDAREVGAERQRDDQQEGDRDQAPGSRPSTVPASSTQRGAGEASSRSNQPCSMSRARLTPVAAPVKPAPCRKLTGIDEARVARRCEAGQLRQAPEHRRQAEEEDRRREHAGDRRAGHAQQLVDGARASARRSSPDFGAQAGISRPSSASCRSARARRARAPIAATIANARRAPSSVVGGVTARR